MSTTLDLPRQTRERPWAMVGGAAAVGFVAGYFIFGSRGEHSRAARSAIDGSFEGLAAASRRPPSPVAPEPPRQPGLLDELLSRVGDEARKLGEMALATATASLRETVQKQVPRLIEDGIPKLIEEGLPRFVGNGRSAERSYSPPDGFTREPYSRATNGPEARSAM